MPFVGFDVGPNVMTLSISDEHWAELIEKVLTFAKLGKQYLFHDFQLLAGYINWSLVIFPLLKPSLAAVYVKMSGKSHPLAPIHIINAICNEL
jgi:cytochrome c oxidase subunit IV